MLRKADCLGVGCVDTLVGSRDGAAGPLSPHPFNFSDDCRRLFREVCLRIVDGLDLETTRYATEPWFNSFYYRPEDIRQFIDSVGDPRVAFHLDQMNLVGRDTYFSTTELIERTFELLRPHVVSVHAKDIRWDHTHIGFKLDEVYVGDGVMDYDTYLRRLDTLDPDMPVYTEHFATVDEFAIAIERLHQAAKKAGVKFLARSDR